MSDIALLNNSLAWAHYRLKGGLRNAAMFAGGYFIVIGGLMLMSLRVDPAETQNIMYGWMVVLLTLQSLILLFYGGNAVRNAVRKDMTTGMLSSHRLMPISGTEAVAGYVIGSATTPLLLALATLLLGILACGPAQLNVRDWVLGNSLILYFAVCTWVAVASISLLSSKAGGVFFAVILLCIPGGVILLAVPALTLICTPLVGTTVFGMVTSGATWGPAYQTSMFAQLIVTALFFIVGARKFRREDVMAAGPGLGAVIVAVFVALSITALRDWKALQPTMFRGMGPMLSLQLISSLMAGLLLAFIPVSAAAWLQEGYLRRRQLGDIALGRRPVSFVVMVVASSLLLVCLPMWFVPIREEWSRLLAIFVCLLATLLPIGCLMRIRYRRKTSATGLIAIWITATWVGPWALSVMRLVAAGVDEAIKVPDAWEQSEIITGFSPLGTIISAATSPEPRIALGLGFQVVLAAVVTVLFYIKRRTAHEIIVPVMGA